MKRIRVLIADDHRDFRKVLHDFLSHLPNVSVVGEACDGDDAVEQAGKLNPDVVLMDIQMPHKNGLEATKIIKDRWPEIKVVIATLSDSPEYRNRAQEVHADGFIVKSELKPSLELTFSVSALQQQFPPTNNSNTDLKH